MVVARPDGVNLEGVPVGEAVGVTDADERLHVLAATTDAFPLRDIRGFLLAVLADCLRPLVLAERVGRVLADRLCLCDFRVDLRCATVWCLLAIGVDFADVEK